MKETAYEFLNQNKVLHMAMLEGIRKDEVEYLAADERGVLLRDKASGICMISVSDLDYGRQLIDELDTCYQMVTCQEELIDYIMAKYGFTEIFSCKKVVYLKKEKPELKTELTIIEPDAEYLQKIKDVYHTIPPEEVDEIHRRGNLFCAFHNGDFVGYAGNHLDGSIGLLEIFEPYQGNGFGEQLEIFMIHHVMDKGDIPYGEIVLGNTVSANLQDKLGFETSKETITWLL